MIHAATRFRLARVSLAAIAITDTQPLYEQRIMEYVARLRAAPTDEILLALGVRGELQGVPLFYVQDGRHRFVASKIAARSDALALIAYEPGDPGYEDASAPLAALSTSPAAAEPIVVPVVPATPSAA